VFLPFALACGSKDQCVSRNVRCEAPLTCDPDDGVCKCGGHGGVRCPDMFVCDSATNTCQSTRCNNVDCSQQPGTSCDRFDGVCKCGGTGGKLCDASQHCDPIAKSCVPEVLCGQKACGKNRSC